VPASPGEVAATRDGIRDGISSPSRNSFYLGWKRLKSLVTMGGTGIIAEITLLRPILGLSPDKWTEMPKAYPTIGCHKAFPEQDTSSLSTNRAPVQDLTFLNPRATF